MGKRVILVALLAGVGAVIFLALPRERPKILWQIDIRPIWGSAPAVGSDGTIYFGDQETNLCAVAHDGSLRWKARLPPRTSVLARYLWSPSVGPSKDIYVTSSVGELFAFSPTGPMRWFVDTGVTHGTLVAFAVEGAIYVGSTNGQLHAFNADGPPRWTFKTVGDKTGNPVIAGDGTIYVACNSSNLYALNPDGTLKWTSSNAVRFSGLIQPIAGPDGTIYVECYPKFHAIRPDGTVRWSLTTYAAGQSAVLNSTGTLFLCDSNGVLAVKADTGKVLWKHTAPDCGLLPSRGLALARDGTIYFSGDRSINAIDRKGRLKWTFRRDPSPEPSRESLLQRFSGWLSARLSRPNSAAQKFRPIDAPGFTLTEDGRLYALMPDLKVYALEVSSGLDTNAPWPMFMHDVQHSGRAAAASR